MRLSFIKSFQYAPFVSSRLFREGDGGMQYYSLNHISPKVNFAEAAVRGQAPDKGLYFPSHIPQLSEGFIKNISSYSKEAIGFTVMKPFVGDTIPDDV